MCGQPLTTGNPLVQWYISDRVSSPPEYQSYYHEHLSLLPTSYLTNSLSANSHTNGLWRQNPSSSSSSSSFSPTNNVGRVKYGLAEEDVVLAYFGQIYKIDSSVFAVWVYLIDYGLSGYFVDENNEHLPVAKTKDPLRGT